MTGLAGLLSKRYDQEEYPDMRGKTAIVTGGTAGIGRRIAKGLAIAGARVIIVGATPDHADEAISEIKAAVEQSSTGSPKFASGAVEARTLDLGSLSEVKTFAEKMLKELEIGEVKETEEDDGRGKGQTRAIAGNKTGGLHLLVNDAGVGVAPFGLTKDGLGNHFQINHLSHMLLSTMLLPLLEKSADGPATSRIVSQSSELHRGAPSDVEFKTVEEMNQDRDGAILYNRSKLMMILFTKQLAKRRLAKTGNNVVAIATHPGAVATEQQKGAEEEYGLLGAALTKVSQLAFMSPEQGAECALWASLSPVVAEDAGKYQGAYLRQPDDSVGNESAQAQDEQLAVNLWELSKRVIQDKTGFVIDY